MKELLTDSLDLISNGVVITDPSQKDNPIVYINKAFSAITGYSDREVLGKNCRFLQGPDRFYPEMDKLRQAIKKRKPVTVILKNYRKNGQIFWNELHISPVSFKGKEYFIGIQNDVTQRVIAQEELKSYQKKLESMVSQRTAGLIEANNKLAREIDEHKQAQKKIIILNNRLILHNKKLEKKLVQRADRLTKNEEKIVSALQHGCQESLAAIQKMTGLPKSTISVAKKRLLDKHISRIVVPSLGAFGLLTIVEYKDTKLTAFPQECFFGVQGKSSGFFAMLNKDWREFNKTYSALNLNDSTKLHHIDPHSSKISILGKPAMKVQYSLKEAVVLYGLCTCESKSKIPRKIGLSQPTVSKYLDMLSKGKKFQASYYRKIKNQDIVLLSRHSGNIFGADHGGWQIGISSLTNWEELDLESIVIPTSEINLFKFDFSGAVKTNFLIENSRIR